MSQADAFLQAILEHPDDDATRLIFADWLTEQDDPRGELIHVQYQLEDLPGHDPRRPLLEERQRELLVAWGEEWATPVCELIEGERVYTRVTRGNAPLRWEFRRGFIEKLTLACSDLCGHGEALVARTPLRAVQLHRVERKDAPRGVLRLPFLAQLRELDLTEFGLTGADARQLFQAPSLSGIRALRLVASGLEGVGPTQLREAPFAPVLTDLHVSAGPWEYYGAARRSPAPRLHPEALPRLRQLAYNGCHPATEDLRGLARSGQLCGLALCGSVLPQDLLEGLSAAWGSGKLERLRLGRCRLDEAGARTLGHSPLLEGLQALDLEGSLQGDTAAGALVQAGKMGELAMLGLAGCRLGAKGALALVAPGRLGQLRTLLLRGNRLGDEGAEALARPDALPSLEVLQLSYSGIGPGGVRRLAEGPPGRLRVLDLSWSKVGDEGALALASSEGLAGLTGLDLSYAEIGDEGAAALAGSPHLGRLESLNLCTNRIGDRGLEALARSTCLPRLTSLNLGHCRITRRGLTALGDAPLRGRLTALNLAGNGLPAGDVAALRREMRGIVGG